MGDTSLADLVCGQLLSEGQKKKKDGAAVRCLLCASHQKRAVVPLEDLVADPHPQAGSADALGGVEGLIEAPAGLGGHTDACIRDGYKHALRPGARMRSFPASEKESSTVRHRVDGVADEVIEDLPDLTFQAEQRLSRTETLDDFDVVVEQTAVVEGQAVPQQIVDVGRCGSGGLLVKAQRLARDHRDAAQFPLGCCHVVADLGEVIRVAQEKQEVGYRLEGVVDLVRDGGGEPADSGELLILPQSCLGAFVLRDVLEEDGDAVCGGLDLDQEPYVKRVSVESFERSALSLRHGAMVVLDPWGARRQEVRGRTARDSCRRG